MLVIKFFSWDILKNFDKKSINLIAIYVNESEKQK